MCKPDGSSKGFGFLTFDNPNSAAKIIKELNEAELDGRIISVCELMVTVTTIAFLTFFLIFLLFFFYFFLFFVLFFLIFSYFLYFFLLFLILINFFIFIIFSNVTKKLSRNVTIKIILIY